jgi:hypothetical protein
MKNCGVLGLVMLLGIGGAGSAIGQGPDPAKVKQMMDRYEAAAEEAARKATPKPRPKPVARPAPTVDHDREAWQSAEKCGTTACFEAYLEDYPKGRYAKMARARLKTDPEPESRPAVVTERPAPAARPTNQRFTDSGDGTVTDNQSGLIWLKNANCFDRQDWSTAMASARSLANGDCGLRDGSGAGQWRLPRKEEWETLIDKSAFNPALPSGLPFTGIQSGPYWSSTHDASDTSRAWFVRLNIGDVDWHYKTNDLYVWPVRGGR